MRPAVLAVIGLLLAASLLLLWLAERKPRQPVSVEMVQPDRSVPPVAAMLPTAVVTNGADPVADAGGLTPPPMEVVAADEVQIQQWLQSRGADALPGLLGKLDNASAEVRGNALEALKQLGDRQAIPVLQQKAETISDPAEKARILAAADFLAMPKFGEK